MSSTPRSSAARAAYRWRVSPTVRRSSPPRTLSPSNQIRPTREDISEGAAAAAAPRRPPGSRVLAFLRASWAELQRVQWPDRRHVFQATAVVLGFVVVAGVYLGLADWVAQKIINFIL